MLCYESKFHEDSEFESCCSHDNVSENVKFSDIFYIIESHYMWLQKAIFDNKKGAFPSDFR